MTIQMIEIEQQITRRIEELQVLKQAILNNPGDRLSIAEAIPNYKAEYINIADYMKTYEWNHS